MVQSLIRQCHRLQSASVRSTVCIIFTTIQLKQQGEGDNDPVLSIMKGSPVERGEAGVTQICRIE